MSIFNRADILLPGEGVDLGKWACVACDQFTSEPEYWRRAEELVGDAPSTLRMMLPEAYLGERDQEAEAERISAAMDRYLSEGLLRTVEDSFIYVERTLATGLVRRGLIGTLDLESYDWADGTGTPIRATEGTVEDRLPPRVKVRMGAALEMPHIMVFINDPENALIPSAAGGEELYDFELMGGGGRLWGSRVTGDQALRVGAAIDALPGEVKFAMGDGNHSLAAAKRCWEAIKPGLTEEQRKKSPARYALVELVNIHDRAVTIEPIHRVLFGTDAGDFIPAAKAAFKGGDGGFEVAFLSGDRRETLSVPAESIGALIGAAEAFCQAYIAAHGGTADYIHGDGEAEAMARRPGCAGVLLPAMGRGQVFLSVERTGPFPKKSFSIGLGPDKRYYLECRRIK